MMQRWLNKESEGKGAQSETTRNKSIDKSSKTPTLGKHKVQLAMASAAYNTSKRAFLTLEPAINDPSVRVYKDDDFVCIKDKYPKAKHHFLLIPLLKIDGKYLTTVSELLQLAKADQLLEKMKNLSEKIIEGLNTKKGQAIKFNMGFHAVQSMYPLHMHIISDDMCSDCLKNKKHYNSFTTDYFVPLHELAKLLGDEKSAASVISHFELTNKSKLEGYLKLDIKCHHCQAPLSTIPNLKKHLLTHA